jgi:hypothetical protein
MGSIFTFHTNHAVPSNIRKMPVGRCRGNFRAAAVRPAGLTSPYTCGTAMPSPSKMDNNESFIRITSAEHG